MADQPPFDSDEVRSLLRALVKMLRDGRYLTPGVLAAMGRLGEAPSDE